MGAKLYPAYKDSGVEWIGEIPEHWEVKRTKSVVAVRKVIAGQLGYEVISVTQRGLRPKNTSSFEGQNAQDYSKYQLVDVDDFVLNHMDLLTGYVGKSTYEGVTSPDYRVVRTVDANRTGKNFTLFLFQNCYHHKLWYKYGQGAAHLGRWRLPRQEFNEFQLPSPPIEEQKIIASFLDRETGKIDTLVEQQQQLISLLKEKRQSLISHTVTKGLNPNVQMKDSGVEWIGEIPEHWEVKQFRTVGAFYGGLSGKAGPDFSDAGANTQYFIPFTNILNNTYINWNELKPVQLDPLEKQNKVRSGDLLFLMSSEDYEFLGWSSVADNVPGNVYLNSFCKGLHVSENVSGAFVNYFNKSIPGRSLIGSVGNGFTRINLRASALAAVRIPFPPLDEQKQIATFLDTETSKIDQLIEKANQSIALLKERRSSLISAAVTGKIDVREAA